MATPNYAETIPGIQVMTFTFPGNYNSTVTPCKFKMPFKAEVLGVSAYVRSSSGTSPTLTIDIREGTSSILSSAISMTADTITEGTISDKIIDDEATVSIVFTIGGGSPQWSDITVLLTVRRAT